MFDLPASLRAGALRLAGLAVAGAEVVAITLEDGTRNHALAGGGGPAAPIGRLELSDSRLRILHAPLDADFTINLSTRTSLEGPAELRAEGAGRYAGAPSSCASWGARRRSSPTPRRPGPSRWRW